MAIPTTQNNEICLLLPNCNFPARGALCIVDTFKDLKELIIGLFKQPLKQIIKFITHPFLWSFVFMVICGYWNGIFQVLTQKRFEKWAKTHPQVNDEIVIADVAFDILPQINIILLPEILAAIFIGFTLLRFFVTPYRWVILRRYFFLQGIIYFIRGLCVFTTILPDPSGRPSTVNTSNVFVEGFLVLLGIHRVECDMMFSGNAASMVICACLWHHYSHKAPIIEFDLLGDTPNSTPYGYPLRMTLIKLIMWIITIGCFILYIANRMHYIADVYIGFVFSLFLFKLYHNYILFCSTRHNLINSFFKWFESDAPDIPAVVKVPMDGISSSDAMAN
ncbi:membrane-spanning protein, putative [Entamoeba nuttalli P19]|uniref:Membrane-spanning protein, putative n=1 Tax=Entamoeba nuttalli (strain P19) TaxID=1076696 RepID=K2H4J5_ENTNP|nr:membrane-spanning protein, putative [Entamoeba nuttalli P19]EKE41222.1 membrane-spanning protein, putative [Entamoeba nuttalli P19]|eukprot:XP_008856446.1 membrane-spanning protein, putative [Entamoeba nuttalli P19]